MELDKRVIKFIKRHNVLTLATATSRNGAAEPYCSNMFYAYIPEHNLFVFTSDQGTRHIADITENPCVAGSIVLESMAVGKLQGLQFQGVMFSAEQSPYQDVKSAYLLRFPFAAMTSLNLWVIKPTFMKYTDNRLGFGTKLIWSGDEQ